MPGRVEMRAVVGRELHLLHRPALPVRQILGLEPLEERQQLRQTLLVVEILNGRIGARRIGRRVVLQRYGNVDQFSRHALTPPFPMFSGDFNAARLLSSRVLTLNLVFQKADVLEFEVDGSPCWRSHPFGNPLASMSRNVANESYPGYIRG